MWNYARFYLMYPLLIATFAGIYAGGPWMWTGTAVLFVLAVGGDFALPEDLGGWRPAHPLLVDAALYGTFPFIVALVVALLWRAVDPAAVPAAGAALQALVAWRASPPASALDVFGGALSTSLLIGIAATNVAHELMHRRGVAGPLMAKALLVFSFDLPLVTSHLYGHHIRVGTRADHTTARRGESSFRFIARSTLCGNLNAWRIECERLRNQGRAPAGPANRWLRGHALALACVGAAGLIAGPWGAALFFACALAAKSILELINYIQHYGLIRVEGTPIGARHSWNSNKWISTSLLCNVTRHSHHHTEPETPFWELRPVEGAPDLPLGYLTSMMIALVPPLWHRHLAHALLDWDAQLASADERLAAQRDNAASGVARLRAGAREYA